MYYLRQELMPDWRFTSKMNLTMWLVMVASFWVLKSQSSGHVNKTKTTVREDAAVTSVRDARTM